MIREFFSPRVFLFFLLLWVGCFAATWSWRQLNKHGRRKAWNVGMAVGACALVALLVCVVVVVLLVFLT
jgi:uncharacterized protein HemY